MLVNASGGEGLDVLVLQGNDEGVSFTGAWEGIGMTGNSSIEMVLDGVEVPEDRIVGAEGDGQELVFNVVAPTFLIGLAAVTLPVSASVKSPASTPVTASLNVTVNVTLAAFVVVAAGVARLIDTTNGATWSMV